MHEFRGRRSLSAIASPFRIIVIGCLVWLLIALPAAGEATADTLLTAKQITIEQLSTHMIARLGALPGVASVTPLADGRLELITKTGRSLSIGLANLVDALNEDVGQRQRHLDEHVATLAGVVAGPSMPAALLTAAEFSSALIPVVKPASYVDEFRRVTGGAAEKKRPLLVKSLVGDIVLVIGLDSPGRTQILQTDSGKPYGLSDDKVIARAIDNLRDRAGRLEVSASGPLNIIQFDPNYAASLLAVPEVWIAMEKQFGGDLAVVVPARDVVIFAQAGNSNAIAALRAIASKPNQAYPITTHLLRFNKRSWSVLE